MTTYKRRLSSPKWQKKRLEILQRDKWKCQFCGCDDTELHVHHIGYNGNNPWDTSDKLLITLCIECHELEERNLDEYKKTIFNDIRRNGFTSLTLTSMMNIFSDTDRGWSFNEPSLDIIKMVVDDDELWEKVSEIFWQRINGRANG